MTKLCTLISVGAILLMPNLAIAETPHSLATHLERIRTDVLYLKELADIQERLILTAEQDSETVVTEGRRGNELCKNSPVENVCALLPYTVGEDDG